MKTTLVGYTGFVGSNLKSHHRFDYRYNTKNIVSAFDIDHKLVVYSGVYSKKYVANQNPDNDLNHIKDTILNIEKMAPEKLVLISTVDVYPNAVNVDEDTEIEDEKLQAYGRNRHFLENWVKDMMSDHLIIRLPALYGNNLSKNFIYDMVTIIPTMIKGNTYLSLEKQYPKLTNFYTKQDNGFFKVKNLSETERIRLKDFFGSISFNALSFTDSRNSYQFYNLSSLWGHIQNALSENIRLLNVVTEPVTAAEVFQYINGKKFNNEFLDLPFTYDIKTKYADLFSGYNGYLATKQTVLEDIKMFVDSLKKCQ